MAEENVGEETGDLYNGFDKDIDSVQVNSPGKDSSVAEAKPVGLAIAGAGGVASSKPSVREIRSIVNSLNDSKIFVLCNRQLLLWDPED